MMEGLRSLVTCPVCFFVRSKYFQCVNGHIICQICMDKLTKLACPSCKTKYSTTRVRSLQTEQFIALHKIEVHCMHDDQGCNHSALKGLIEDHEEKCSFRVIKCPHPECKISFKAKDLRSHNGMFHRACSNKGIGCQFTGSLTDWKEHQKTCPFMQVKCPSPFCSVRMMKNQVLEHLLGGYIPKTVIQRKEVKTLYHQNMKTKPFLILHESKYFLQIIEKINGFFHVYLVNLAIPDESANYNVQLKTYKDKKDEMEISRKIKMFSMDSENAHSKNCQECLVLSEIEVEQLKDSKGKVWIDYEILRK